MPGRSKTDRRRGPSGAGRGPRRSAPRVLELEGRRLLAASPQFAANDAAFVTNLFELVLFREPSAAEVGVWTGYLGRGASERAMTRSFLHSEERADLVRSLGVDLNGSPPAFVDSLYASLLGRQPDPKGGAYWARVVAHGADRETVVQDFLDSGEFPGVATTTLLAVQPTSTAPGAPVTLTAGIVPRAGSLAPTGVVEFFRGSTLVGTAPVSGFHAELTTTSLPTGDGAITAVYEGDSRYMPSTSTPAEVTVARAASVVVLDPVASPVAYTSPVRFEAIVSAADGGPGVPAGFVDFYLDGTFLGRASGTDAVFQTEALPLGTSQITAVYEGDAGFAGATSSPLSVTTVPYASYLSILAPTPTTAGSAETITARVARFAGGPVPTGTIHIEAGSLDLGTQTLDASGQVTVTTTLLPPGSDLVVAQYSGDANYALASISLPVTVQPAAT